MYHHAEIITACHPWACSGIHSRRIHIAPDVQAENRVRVVHYTLRNTHLRPAAGFFCRLKQEADFPGKRVAVFRQNARRAQQHRGMHVMPAGMHHALAFACVGQACFLRNGQRIHIGAQNQRTGLDGIFCAAQHPPQACFFRKAMDFDTQRGQFAFDTRGGLLLLPG